MTSPMARELLRLRNFKPTPSVPYPSIQVADLSLKESEELRRLYKLEGFFILDIVSNEISTS